MNNSSYKYCLLPELVTDLVEDLLASDVISKKEISKLKNDTDITSLDPTLVMDLRHKKTRNTSAIGYEEKYTSKYSGRIQEIPVAGSSVKDLKTIDKEIAMTRKELERLNNQMSKNEEFLSTSILAIEEEGKQILNVTAPVQFNETEVKKYFDIHLDSLEDKIKADKSSSGASKKLWTPLQIEFPPVINVETTSKISDSNQLEFEFNIEELSILELFEIKPISVIGKPVEQVSFCDKIKKQHEPACTAALPNSIELYKRDSMNCRNNSLSSQEMITARVALGKWKKYARQLKIKSFSDKMKKQTLNSLLKKVLITWHLHTKNVKSMKDARMRQPSKVSLEHSQVNCGTHSFNKIIEVSNEYATEHLRKGETTDEHEINNSKNNKKNTRDDCFLTKPMNICSRNNNSTKCVFIDNESKISSNDCDAKVINFDNKRLTNNHDTSYIHQKIVTPDCVGLSYALKNPKLQNTKPNTTANKDNGFHKSLIKLSTNSEQFYFRYAAQEKIIAEQLAVIEKQKQIILDLQVENLEKNSALHKITIDTQLKIANAMLEKRQICHMNKEAEKAAHVKTPCIEDKSLELTSRMLTRNEYCKQLAEKTKNRKIRIEEEKARIKVELEEREKIEKDEKKKQRLKQIRLEQVRAEKSSKIYLEKKQRIDELIKTAINHYNRILLRRVFHKLKEATLEAQLNTHQCDEMFEKKLLKRTFHYLKTYARESLAIKYEAADQFYKVRLIERYWCYWRQLHLEYKIKIQVSEDMFELSLQRRMFHKWQDFMSEQYKQNCLKKELADRLYSRKLMQQCLKKWRELPQQTLAEREREMRLRVWRRAVQEIIPDFKPVQVEPLDN